MSNIRLSEKHGVNPTIPLCFWCGKEKNELLLLGKLKGDAQAPMTMCFDYDPCDDCEEKFAQGITLIEARQGVPFNEGQPSLPGTDSYPSGRYAVIDERAMNYESMPEQMAKDIKEGRKALILPEEFEVFFVQGEEGE